MTTKAEWQNAKVHHVTLPSGMKVDITIPDLAAMAKAGELDNDLIQYAIPSASEVAAEPEELTPEQKKENLARLADFHDWLVSITVVEPKLAPEEVANVVPTPDKEVLVELASRRRDMDVVGHHIGGLEASPAFRKFREIDSGESDILDA